MAYYNNDILVEIPDEFLPDLVNFYKTKATWAPYMATCIHNAIKWKQSDKSRNLITLLSPQNSWKQDGTVIILTKIYSQDVYVFTLDDNCVNLYKGLSETNRIMYDVGKTFFCAVHEKHILTVKKVIQEKKRNIKWELPAAFLALPPEKARELTLECPSEVIIKKLQLSDANKINDVYRHTFLNSDKHIESLIDINGGYGVYLKSINQGTDELAAWLIRHVFGTMIMLQTDVRHKRKGYASLVTKALAKEIGKEGYWAVSTVIPHNKSAISMFESLGFKIIGSSRFISVE